MRPTHDTTRLAAGPATVAGQRAWEEGCLADEAGDEAVPGTVIDDLRPIDLVQPAVAHHCDPIAEREGLVAFVGDEDGCGAPLADRGDHVAGVVRQFASCVASESTHIPPKRSSSGRMVSTARSAASGATMSRM